MATRLAARAIIRQAATQTWADARQPERARLVAPGARRRRATLDVTLQGISDKGLLFESQLHLPVGAHAQLRMRTGEDWSLVEGFVVRCRVTAVGDGPVSYETALQFDDARPVNELQGSDRAAQRGRARGRGSGGVDRPAEELMPAEPVSHMWIRWS